MRKYSVPYDRAVPDARLRRPARPCVALPFVLALCLACHDERPHVFHTPAPKVPPPAEAPLVPTPEPQIGTNGPEAQITVVTDAATGAPIPLTGIAAPFDVMTIVARGPGTWRPGRTPRIELRIHGSSDTTLVRPLESPAPVIVAHVFHVPALRAGNYTAQVRLVMRGEHALAESVPLHLVVVR